MYCASVPVQYVIAEEQMLDASSRVTYAVVAARLMPFLAAAELRRKLTAHCHQPVKVASYMLICPAAL